MQKRRKFTPEFRASVVKQVELGRKITEISADYGLRYSLIHRWCTEARGQMPKPAKKPERSIADMQAEIDALQRLLSRSVRRA